MIPEQHNFHSIEEVVEDIRQGKLVIVTDDRDRENEGDLVAAAEKITPEMVNFMAKYGRGLICVPIDHKIASHFHLNHMVPQNRENFSTNFTVSVDAAEGITTGISTYDRARTIQILANSQAKPDDLVQPGHVFPLKAKKGGVLRRAGHTEAAVDLAVMAGLSASGVVCEILNEDGTMARLPELTVFAQEHDLKICTIESLIEYRRRKEKLVERLETIHLPTKYGEFVLHMYKTTIDHNIHLALVSGEINGSSPTLVRVHSECLTGDVFHSLRCDCGSQLHAAMQQIGKRKHGVLLYMRQEGRGIGLEAKIKAYKLQEKGLDTVEANEKLGYSMDLRDYGVGGQILHDIGVKKMHLLTNNPKKVVGLRGHGLEIEKQIPLKQEENPHNKKYLETKKKKMGHLL